MGGLLPLYIATAVFGVGVTIADLLGLFSHLALGGGHGSGGVGHDAGGHDAGGHDAGGHVVGGHDVGGHDVGSHDAGGPGTGGAHGASHDIVHGPAHSAEQSTGSAVAQDVPMRGSLLMSAMGIARSAVYFCLGFGPVGLFAMTQYHSPALTLLWSIPVGAVVMVGTRALRSLASREISSDIGKDDLLMERGVVTVSIASGQMGRVRVTVGGKYVDWYARSATDVALPVGTRIRVVDATEECVLVEED